ncbi:MarR family winged helix-turn-helix transcriptional regulator [Paenibacillus tengchongensis]|uniref:MarR family winged helix-turn-helix transcriptional regulator n=1 Tax=Paenibacillus tengchongensis TaxID=2608684 RepID=UPI001651BAC8|nr:MarR family winged helix-turn-helix transcriptional regulator [Paenibacillus tengchongensis]
MGVQPRTVDIYNSFFAVSRQLKKLAHQSAAELGLTVHQIGILNTVLARPGLTQKEVTEQLVFAKSRVSLHIDALVEKGLVDRRASEQDRRETRLYITAAGEECCLRYNTEAAAFKVLEEALSRFTESETAGLLKLNLELLGKLKQAAEQ